MKKIMIAIMFLNGFVYGQNQSTNTIGSEVPVYEYVPKVIIEGKWGKGEGEFGVISDPMDAEYLKIAQYPHSLAVNSKGDIYVLDQVNNRIQKFNKDGKYIKSIEVLGLVDNKDRSIVEVKREMVFEVKGKPFTEGINIVIDNKDRMYYYLKRSSYSAEGVKLTESGEVWEFVDDKLRKKNSVKSDSINDPKNPKPVPLKDLTVNNIFNSEFKVKNNEYIANEKENKKELRFSLNKNEELYGYKKVTYNKQDKEWRVRVKSKSKIWDKIYSENGKLLKQVEAHYVCEIIDSQGSCYFIETDNNGLRVGKDEFMRVK